jgi:predicted secreted protein
MVLTAKKLKQNNMEKTAVEWLVNQLKEGIVFNEIEVIEKAKEMEKQQIVSAFNKGFVTDQWDKSKENKSEQYYNETFESE